MAEAKSTPSAVPKLPPLKDDDSPKCITSRKLDGVNYLSWAHAVQVYLRSKRRLKYITDNPPPFPLPVTVYLLTLSLVVRGAFFHRYSSPNARVHC